MILGNIDVCKILIENNANVTAVNERGGTPLHYAKTKGICYTNLLKLTFLDDHFLFHKLDVAEILIQNGATNNVTNIFGNTPLHEACLRGW